MSDELFIDASEPVVGSDDAPLAFAQATAPDTSLSTSGAGRIAMDGNKYRIALIRNRKNELR